MTQLEFNFDAAEIVPYAHIVSSSRVKIQNVIEVGQGR